MMHGFHGSHAAAADDDGEHMVICLALVGKRRQEINQESWEDHGLISGTTPLDAQPMSSIRRYCKGPEIWNGTSFGFW
jgi:hypothetical protein